MGYLMDPVLAFDFGTIDIVMVFTVIIISDYLNL
jgi:hypothetical protein